MKILIIIGGLLLLNWKVQGQSELNNQAQYTAQELLGTWENLDINSKATHFDYLVFKMDGSMDIIVANDTASATWSIDKNILTIRKSNDHSFSTRVIISDTHITLWDVGFPRPSDTPSKYKKIKSL